MIHQEPESNYEQTVASDHAREDGDEDDSRPCPRKQRYVWMGQCRRICHHECIDDRGPDCDNGSWIEDGVYQWPTLGRNRADCHDEPTADGPEHRRPDDDRCIRRSEQLDRREIGPGECETAGHEDAEVRRPSRANEAREFGSVTDHQFIRSPRLPR